MKKNWLQHKTVIISGASGGLGFNIAKKLIFDYNCNVIGIGRNKEKTYSNIETLKDKKDKFTCYFFDVSVKENWINFYNDLTEKGVSVDALINNAGFMLPFKTFEKCTDEEIEEIINTNFTSYVNSTKILLPLLKKSTTPAIINISSSAGLCAVVGESMYCATKYAVRGFTETLIEDYKKKIYVAGVYPGFIKTDILNRMSVSDKNNKAILKMMMPIDKATKIIVKKISKKNMRIVLGFDGKSMGFFARLFPVFTPSVITKVLKKSRLELFSDVFDYDGKQ